MKARTKFASTSVNDTDDVDELQAAEMIKGVVEPLQDSRLEKLQIQHLAIHLVELLPVLSAGTTGMRQLRSGNVPTPLQNHAAASIDILKERWKVTLGRLRGELHLTADLSQEEKANCLHLATLMETSPNKASETSLRDFRTLVESKGDRTSADPQHFTQLRQTLRTVTVKLKKSEELVSKWRSGRHIFNSVSEQKSALDHHEKLQQQVTELSKQLQEVRPGFQSCDAPSANLVSTRQRSSSVRRPARIVANAASSARRSSSAGRRPAADVTKAPLGSWASKLKMSIDADPLVKQASSFANKTDVSSKRLVETTRGTETCSVHGKSRSTISLVEDGSGCWRCAPGMICQTSKGEKEEYECSVHNKIRSFRNLEEDGKGGYRCVQGFACQTSSASRVLTPPRKKTLHAVEESAEPIAHRTTGSDCKASMPLKSCLKKSTSKSLLQQASDPLVETRSPDTGPPSRAMVVCREFHGEEWGSEYLTLQHGDLVCSVGRLQDGWAFGELLHVNGTVGKGGWYPPAFVRPVEAKVAQKSWDSSTYGLGYLSLMEGDEVWDWGLMDSGWTYGTVRGPVHTRSGWYPPGFVTNKGTLSGAEVDCQTRTPSKCQQHKCENPKCSSCSCVEKDKAIAKLEEDVARLRKEAAELRERQQLESWTVVRGRDRRRRPAA